MEAERSRVEMARASPLPSIPLGVDMGDQLATKDSVDLDSGIDYGVLECVVWSTLATERDQVIASWVRPLVGSWKGIPNLLSRHHLAAVLLTPHLAADALPGRLWPSPVVVAPSQSSSPPTAQTVAVAAMSAAASHRLFPLVPPPPLPRSLRVPPPHRPSRSAPTTSPFSVGFGHRLSPSPLVSRRAHPEADRRAAEARRIVLVCDVAAQAYVASSDWWRELGPLTWQLAIGGEPVSDVLGLVGRVTLGSV
ncbi:hypothetical protein Scep_028201 [Stephania cephalantha]|uniref:Uncharacterized protein n=1 Tax=Stephania cephalantha TaxID=152367 RepID=A0AAP0E9G9_9MAGN